MEIDSGRGHCPGCCGTGDHSDECRVLIHPVVPETIDQLPTFESAPDELPEMTGDAELVLPTEIFAPWFKSLQQWLDKVGAKQGRDYRSSVAMAGFDKKQRPLWRIKWHASSEKGIMYLNLMYMSLRALSYDANAIAYDDTSKTKENG